MASANPSQKKHVLHACSSESFSGLERYVLDVAQNQAGAAALFCRKDSKLFAEAQIRGISTRTIPRASRLGLRLWHRIRLILRNESPPFDLLHLHHSGELRIFAPVLQWVRGAPKVILQFHLWTNHKKQNPYHAWLYSFVSEVWCSTEQAKTQLEKLLPKGTFIRVIPYGRPTQKLVSIRENKPALRTKYREELGLAADAKIIITAARFEEIKGIHELVDGFFQANLPPEWNLVLIGEPSPEDASAQESFNRLLHKLECMGASDPDRRRRVHISPPCDQVELWQRMCGSDVYALPSYEECFSLALIDAVLLGLPALGTQSGGTPSLLQEGKDGISIGELVTPRDFQALSAGLRRLVDSFEKKKIALNAVLPQLEKKYAQTTVAEQIINIYDEVGGTK